MILRIYLINGKQTERETERENFDHIAVFYFLTRLRHPDICQENNTISDKKTD